MVVVDAGPQPDADASLNQGDGGLGDGAVLMCQEGECVIGDPGSPGAGCGSDEVCTLERSGPLCAATSSVGAASEGQRCSANGDCQPGLSCFLETAGATCRVPCCPGATSCARGTQCVGGGMVADGWASSFSHCSVSESCDVLSRSACASGEGCYIVSETGETECRRAGFGGVGEACVVQQDCIPGLFCGGVRTRTCQRICELEAGGAACPQDEGVCVSYSHTPAGSGLCTPVTTGA